jgi:hypothetical protein
MVIVFVGLLMPIPMRETLAGTDPPDPAPPPISVVGPR